MTKYQQNLLHISEQNIKFFVPHFQQAIQLTGDNGYLFCNAGLQRWTARVSVDRSLLRQDPSRRIDRVQLQNDEGYIPIERGHHWTGILRLLHVQ